MIPYIVIGVTFLLLAVFSLVMIFVYIRRPIPEPLPPPMPIVSEFARQPTPVVELRHLNNLNNWYLYDHLRALILEGELNKREPRLYAKFLHVFETHMDHYYGRLLTVLERNNPELYQILTMDPYYDKLSVNDQLLIMLMDTDLQNKEIAEILCIPLETQKKRKLRLRARMEQYGGIPKTIKERPEN